MVPNLLKAETSLEIHHLDDQYIKVHAGTRARSTELLYIFVFKKKTMPAPLYYGHSVMVSEASGNIINDDGLHRGAGSLYFATSILPKRM